MEPIEIKNTIAEYNEDALFIDGLDGDKEAFNNALIGMGGRCGMTGIAIYDSEKVKEILMNKYEMDYENATEWYEYNIIGAYAGENTPLFVDDLREI